MASDSKRGILKKDGSMSASRGRAVWNEGNLAENEQIKAELNTTKIDEPKTPYHAPIDEDIEMEPLDLNDPVAPRAAPEEGATACVPKSGKPALPASPDDEFAAARQEHYSMKNALQRGKALLQEEDEEDDDSGKEGGLAGVDGSSN